MLFFLAYSYVGKENPRTDAASFGQSAAGNSEPLRAFFLYLSLLCYISIPRANMASVSKR